MGGTRVIGAWLILGSFIALSANACSDDPQANGTTGGVDGGGADTGPTNETGPYVPTGDGSVIGPTTGPVDPAVLARAAVVLASCITEFEAESVLDQMYSRVREGFNDYRSIATCIDSRKNGCQAIADCTGIFADLTGPCADSCTGSVAEACDDAFHVRIDCARYGRVCTTTTSGNAGCTVPGAVTCDSSSFTKRCGTDGRPVDCEDQHEEPGPNCATYGLTCSDARGQCAGTEGACQAVSGDADQIIFEGKTCVGSSLSACVGGGMTTLDCGTLVVGATCQTGTDGGVGTTAYCGLGTQCKPGDPYQMTCDGDNVVVCNGGRLENVDCKALGFAGCMTGFNYAFCTPSLKATAFTMKSDGG